MIIIEDQELIESYHFGSESMITHGGGKYASKEFYAWIEFTVSMVSISGFVLGILALIKDRRLLTYSANYLCGLFAFLIIVSE